MKTKRFVPLISLLLFAAGLMNLTSCSLEVQASDLMKDIPANDVKGKQSDDRFIANSASFSIELFKKSVEKGKNTLISPVSVLLALAMTANGADNGTLNQMQTVLGKDIPIDELNEYLYYYVKKLPNGDKAKLNIANSIWFRNDLTVEKDFLQKNADYYKAAAFKSAFDDRTVNEINDWVKKNTDGLIDKILEQIPGDAVMYLINTLLFDAEWETMYSDDKVSKGDFTAYDGSKQKAMFMNSDEHAYLDDGNAVGFIKPYAYGYSFVALLPNEDVSIDDYIASMTGEGFMNLIKNKEFCAVNAYLPKFSVEYEINMNETLKAMGMPDAFAPDKADFTKISKSGGLYIGEVRHKTYIEINERGTRAGAATIVDLRLTAAPEKPKVVRLDRPFIYAIIDDATNLPLFIGTVTSMN
ncbi:MAG TPA: serpin family protein [Bacillota bacterium]|nr:serpin family protein [Bacillota bacterium]HOK69743.1 serpin family protein [Bacillota bacterium]HPP85015.1 serpin family protein [Bacillota bacterium]